jgi:hypothetical protein
MEPDQWAWSSFRSYYYGEPGALRINQWSQVKIKDQEGGLSALFPSRHSNFRVLSACTNIQSDDQTQGLRFNGCRGLHGRAVVNGRGR